MSETAIQTHLPRKLEQKLQLAGEQIRLTRLRRKVTIALAADRAQFSSLTVTRAEKDLSGTNQNASTGGTPRSCQILI